MVGQPVEESRAFHEGPSQYPHLVTGREGGFALHRDEAAVVFARLQRPNNPFRQHRWIVAIADKARDAKRRLYGSPALRRHVDRDEQITRKQRLRRDVKLAGMASALQVARQINFITLTHEIVRGLELAVHLRLNHIPALAGCFAHALPPSLFDSRRPSSAGARTRSAPQASTADANDISAEVTSVTITASNFPATSA